MIESEAEEELVVGKLGRRIISEYCSTGEKALVNDGRVSTTQSMTLVWVS